MSVAEVEELDVNDNTLDKYKKAGEICNKTMAALIKSCVAGKSTAELTQLGHKLIQGQCDAVFNKKNAEGKPMKKGVGFPVCFSVNDCVGNNCHMKSDVGRILVAGDVVKIDFGVHIDYYLAVIAQTCVVGATPEAKTAGKAADVYMAALNAAQAALKTMDLGVTNHEITEVIKKVAECYQVNPVRGVLMHQIKHGVIDGNNCILLREEQEQTVETFHFEAGRIYTIDVIMSTGSGEPIERDAKTTIFKRDLAKKYQLKMLASRSLLSEVDQNHGSFPFSLAQLEDEKQARLGVKECVDHELFTRYPVLFEKADDLVAQFKMTVLIMPSGVVTPIAGLPYADSLAIVNSEKSLTPELQEIINRVPETKKKKKKTGETDGAKKE